MKQIVKGINNTHLLLGIVLVIASIYVAMQMGIFGQCAVCAGGWTSIGTVYSVYNGADINIYEKVQTFNENIQDANKIVGSMEKFKDCSFHLWRTYYYPDSKEFQIWTDEKTSYLIKEGDYDTIYTCPAGASVGLKFSPKNCDYLKNDTTKGQVWNCGGMASVSLYIKSIYVQTMECELDEVNTKTCWDGSEITTSTCVNYQLKYTGEKCPAKPPEMEDDPPECTESLKQECPDGSEITIKKCAQGVYVPTGLTCPEKPLTCEDTQTCDALDEFDGQDTDNIITPTQDNTLTYIIAGVILAIVLGYGLMKVVNRK